MNDGRANIRVGFRSVETWGIIAMLFAAGVAVGFPLGTMVEHYDTEFRVREMERAYAHAINAKDDTVRMCLMKAENAASLAGDAMEKATEKSTGEGNEHSGKDR
ncbi:hypothetical protein D3C76_48210 [compost metagenome]